MEAIEESLFAILLKENLDEKLIDIILSKLYQHKDKVVYCFKNPPAFLTKQRILRIVKLMTNKYWLAQATSTGDYTDIGLRLTKHGVFICKEGGLVKHLGG